MHGVSKSPRPAVGTAEKHGLRERFNGRIQISANGLVQVASQAASWAGRARRPRARRWHPHGFLRIDERSSKSKHAETGRRNTDTSTRTKRIPEPSQESRKGGTSSKWPLAAASHGSHTIAASLKDSSARASHTIILCSAEQNKGRGMAGGARRSVLPSATGFASSEKLPNSAGWWMQSQGKAPSAPMVTHRVSAEVAAIEKWKRWSASQRRRRAGGWCSADPGGPPPGLPSPGATC